MGRTVSSSIPQIGTSRRTFTLNAKPIEPSFGWRPSDWHAAEDSTLLKLMRIERLVVEREELLSRAWDEYFTASE
jgi:hypothetical protein